jgi:flagellar biosynthesis protein FliQ
MNKWEVIQFFVVLLLALIVIIISGLINMFTTIDDWGLVFKPLQLIILMSGFILIIKTLKDKSN